MQNICMKYEELIKKLVTDQLSFWLIYSTYFLLALVVLPLIASFFGANESLSLERAVEGESGESSRNLSSLSAWILWGVGGPVWEVHPSSTALQLEDVGVEGADTATGESDVGEGTGEWSEHGIARPLLVGLEGAFRLLMAVGDDCSWSSFSAWLRVHTVRLGGVTRPSLVGLPSTWPFMCLVGVVGAEMGRGRESWAWFSSGSTLHPTSMKVALSTSATSATGGDLRNSASINGSTINWPEVASKYCQ